MWEALTTHTENNFKSQKHLRSFRTWVSSRLAQCSVMRELFVQWIFPNAHRAEWAPLQRQHRAGKRPQWLKVLATKSANLSLIPGILMVEEGTKLSSDLHLCTVTHTQPLPNTHNECKTKQKCTVQWTCTQGWQPMSWMLTELAGLRS